MANVSALLIAGPTASGKSAFAVQLAKRMDGAIINADSMQVYQDLDILSARPSIEEQQNIPHFLYGHVDASQRYSVGNWLRDVEETLVTLKQQNKFPVFVGGTGLYFKALTVGLAQIPPITSQQHDDFVAAHEDFACSDLHVQLEKIDPKTAERLETNDRQRILRALMVAKFTNKKLTEWHKEAKANALFPLNQTKPIVLMAGGRSKLYERINLRLELMIKRGALKEAAALNARDIAKDLPAFGAIGIKQFVGISSINDSGFENAMTLAKRDTRRFAKRQMTWFRNQMKEWEIIDPLNWKNFDDMEAQAVNLAKELTIEA